MLQRRPGYCVSDKSILQAERKCFVQKSLKQELNEREFTIFKKAQKYMNDSSEKELFKEHVVIPLFKIFNTKSRQKYHDQILIHMSSDFARYYRVYLHYLYLTQDIKTMISIHTDIEHICISFCDSLHQWELDSKSVSLEVNEWKVTVKTPSQNFHPFGWQRICVQNAVSNGVHKWVFRITESFVQNDWDFGFGITNTEEIKQSSNMNEKYVVHGTKSEWGFGVGKTFFQVGDVISVFLDLDGQQKQMQIFQNGQLYRTFSDISDHQYYAAIWMQTEGNCVELL
eukprot:196601_1